MIWIVCFQMFALLSLLVNRHIAQQNRSVLLLLSEFFKPLLGRTSYWGRCRAAIQLSHRPAPSGRADHEEVDGVDVMDNMVDGLFFCATLTDRRGGHTPFVQTGVETSDTGAGAVETDPSSSWKGHSDGGGWQCRGWKCGVLWGCSPTPHSTGDPPTMSPHVCCCYQINWWDVVRRVQMSVSIWAFIDWHNLSQDFPSQEKRQCSRFWGFCP